MEKRLTRNTQNQMVAGVCSGLADYVGVDPTIVRLVFLLLFLPGGISPLLYLLLWLIMPEGAPRQQGGVEPYRYDPHTGEPLR